MEERKNSFIQLGLILSHFTENTQWKDFNCGLTEEEYNDFNELILKTKIHNPWFTEDSVRKSISGIVSMLQKEEIENWLNNYNLEENSPKYVGVIMAGNIPLVGFHDFLCVLISGNKIKAKLSSEDNFLLPFISRILINLDERFEKRIEFIQQLKEYDAVIATGSDNSARYFESYFSSVPHVIRKNRTSVAVITGNETEEELVALAEDVFLYFGKGCRNVTKVIVPNEYDLNNLFKAFYPYKEIVNHNKYANNYDYNKAIYLMNQTELIENGFLLMKEDESLYSPLSVLNYHYIENKDQVDSYLEQNKGNIQCVVGTDYVPFGKAQCPSLSDYADGVDTMKFLLSLN
ncbi:acyl-CoA reductase [Flavobacteriales bacterium]|nr:acyl-CoA reductase [Flavobacteriales bacterium]